MVGSMSHRRRRLAAAIRATAASAGACFRVLRPSLPVALLVNRVVNRTAPTVRVEAGGGPEDAAANPGQVDLGAATALWQAESARVTGLTNKGAGALAAQAVIGAGLATISNPNRAVSVLMGVAIVYLVCALAAAVMVQLPRPVMSVSISDIESGDPARAMLEVVQGNRPVGVRLNNLVASSVSNTARSLVALLGALALGILG